MKMVTGLVFLLLSQNALGTEGDGPDKIKELCTGKFEGAYNLVVRVPSTCPGAEIMLRAMAPNAAAIHGGKSNKNPGHNHPAKMYLFCIDDHRITGTLIFGSGLNSIVTFPYSVIDEGGRLLLTQYMPRAEDRFQNLVGTLEISIDAEALKSQKLQAWTSIKTCTDDALVTGTKAADNNVSNVNEMLPGKKIRPGEIAGHYFMPTENGTAKLKITTVDGVVKVRLDPDGTGNMVHEYLDGPRWNGETAFNSSMVPGALPPTGMLGQLRGKVRADGSLELTVFGPLGVKGPYIATKEANSK